MISQAGKKILEKFVSAAKNLLIKNVTELLQQYYGIWSDGHSIPMEQLPNQDTDFVHTAKMLRERLAHLSSALPDTEANKERLAVTQLVAEQAFTQLNRFCALRMCEERSLILESIHKGYNSAGFQSYDSIAQQVSMPQYNRYKWYLYSVFDELSIELPAVFDRYSPFGLIFPDESTLLKLLDLINDTQLSEWYDDQTETTVNFWKEDETLGWMFQDYNSLEERRKMREESNKPRNSREMAVRNQFFTPEYIVRFLVDNSLGRIWYEMTGGKSKIGEDQCKYMVRRPDEKIEERAIKEPTDILSLDPTCGSMHFGIYLYEVYEYIYMDAWDHSPELLHQFREIHTRETFRREVPRLILENNIFGCEIDPRALQIAALSLWLRAQRGYDELNIPANERPLIRKSNLVLAEAMPGNKRMLKGLMEELDAPMQRLITKIWDKMKYVGEMGLLLKMEKEIEDDIEYLRKNWSKVNQSRNANLFSTDEEKSKIAAENEARKLLRSNKEVFFEEITERLQEALQQLSAKLGEEEGYENELFSEDATRGFAFIELCQKRFDCIVMNPPFGEGSENSSEYLDDNYTTWSGNLVCAFFERMLEILEENGRLGAIFDKTVLVRSTYEKYRQKLICGRINYCADTGEGVLDAQVETSTFILNRDFKKGKGVFFNINKIQPTLKEKTLRNNIKRLENGIKENNVYETSSVDFANLPNTVIGYNFDENLLRIFKSPNILNRAFIARQGHALVSACHYRLFYELTPIENNIYCHFYNGSTFSLFYTYYREVCAWSRNGELARSNTSVVLRNENYQFLSGIGYGKRGEFVDAHILKKNYQFSVEGLAIPDISDEDAFMVLSLINSIFSQYIINQYCGQHKHVGYMNLLPMPNYISHKIEIENIVNEIIKIKRNWFSMDETNLEYHGLIAQLGIKDSIEQSLATLQRNLTQDYNRYEELVQENDDLWMDLANIEPNSDFREILNKYKSKRPYEELLSIDGASSKNIINKKVMAQEIIMELVGMAFGRWNTDYAKGIKQISEFGDVFDALPFMPTVSLNEIPTYNPLHIPTDGILSNQKDSAINLADHVSDVMHYLWTNKADDLEYELCQLIGTKNLQEYFESPTGFFDYHFKRYTKSRRKAPIYWSLSSEDGSLTYWVYYPKITKNTLPTLVIKLREENERLFSLANAASVTQDRVLETSLRARQIQVESMMTKINDVINSGYNPNHDDGVPVTAAPLVKLIVHRGWNQECKENMEKLTEGEYDWSHLAMSMFPARVTQKAKTDWCLALTHGLEHLCENKPKEKKARKKSDAIQTSLNLE